MIYIELLLTFLKVGAFTFGGGYAMLSLISESVLAYGWMSEAELLNFLGVEALIPGPIAVNMATYIGYEEGGFLGALIATVAVVLPSFIVIIIVAALAKALFKMKPVKAFVSGMRPALCGLMLSVGATMCLSVFLSADTIVDSLLLIDWRSISILAIVIALPLIIKKAFKKEISPILLVIISAALGAVFFGI